MSYVIVPVYAMPFKWLNGFGPKHDVLNNVEKDIVWYGLLGIPFVTKALFNPVCYCANMQFTRSNGCVVLAKKMLKRIL